MADGSGRIYLAGNFTSYNGTAVSSLIRLLPSGALDPSFLLPSLNSQVQRILVMPDGSNSLVATGNFTQVNGVAANYIARFLANGSVDPSFQTGTGLDARAYKILTVPEAPSEIYVLGANSYRGVINNGAVKIRGDGSIDTSFNSGTGFQFFGGGSVFGGMSTTDGSNDIFVATGIFFNHAINYKGFVIAPGITRLNSSGDLVSSFNPGPGTGAFYGTVFDFFPMTDASGRIYAAGNFSSYDGTMVGNIARVLPNGALDTAFATGAGFSGGATYQAMPVADGTGRLYVFGTYSAYQGTAIQSLVRLASDGSLDSVY